MTAPVLKEGPYRLSSTYHKQLSLGANFIRDDDGWVKAEHFTKSDDEAQKMMNSVGLSDISHLVKLSVKSNDVIRDLEKPLGGSVRIKPLVAFKSTESELFSDALVIVLTHKEAFVLRRILSITHLDASGPDHFCVTDLTSYFTGLYLVGPRSREVMSKLTEVNVNPDVLPDFAVSQLPLFHVRSIVLRHDLHGVPGFQIYFDRGFGEYLWDKIMQAGREFDIAPVGSSALKLLGWSWN